MNEATHTPFFAALIAGCFLFTGIAPAQSVQFPTGDSAWTVDITYPHDAATPPPQPGGINTAVAKAKRIEIAQFNNEKKIRVTWTDGHTTEQWTIPNLPVVFKEYPNGIVFPVGNGSMERKFDDFDMPTNLSAFSWLSPACLQEKDPINFQGQLCYHYVGTTNSPAMPRGHSMGPGDSRTVEREAWIDSKTLLPVALNTGTSLCIFTFQQPPTGPLDMPLKFQQGIANYKHVMGYP